MKKLRYWIGWIVCFLIGYGALHYFHDSPSWAATIGGWVVAFGMMGRDSEIR